MQAAAEVMTGQQDPAQNMDSAKPHYLQVTQIKM